MQIEEDDQNRWDEAEELQLQVIEMRKTKLRADYPDTLSNMRNLSFTWKETGKSVQAITLLKECIDSRKRILSPDHALTLSLCSALVIWRAEAEDVK